MLLFLPYFLLRGVPCCALMDIPKQEPECFVAGDTVEWRRTFSDYPASAGWTLAYTFVNAGNLQKVNAQADGDAHLISITAAGSATWSAGDYDWQATVTNSTIRHTVGNGRTEVKPNLAAMSTDGFDARTYARKVLEAIDAQIAARATSAQSDVIEYNIGMRGLKRSEDGLLKLRGIFAAAVWREENPGEFCPTIQATFS